MAMNEAKDRVCQLEHAIRRLDCVKKHLNRNASDIKAEIHANVSRNLECLRGREVSLLSQVDTVLGVKEETLQQQQARLNQALGILQTGLSMVLEDTASEKHLTETLKKLDNVELSPEETPYISFRADHVGLRDSILNYGRVDANGLPLITAFDDPGNPSASLPRHVEEYEDVDHHFFYKTLEEVRKSQNSGSCITVTIPKLSTRVEDWLQKKLPAYKPLEAENTLKLGQPNTAVRPNTLPKSGEGSSVGLSRPSTPGSSCSLNNWLNIIKQHVDQEEEHDFEIIDHSGPSRGTPGCQKVDLKLWLAPSSQRAEEYKSNIFGHIPHDKKVWLIQMRQKMTDSSSGLPHKDMFSHISKDLSTWLRSRAYAKSVSVEKKGHNFFTHISKDKTVWLMKEKPVDKKGDLTAAKSGSYIQDVDKWLLPRQINTTVEVNKNEPKKNMSESRPLFFRTVEEPASPVILEKESRKIPSDIFKPLDLPLLDWLSSSSKNLIAESQKSAALETSPVDLFQHIRNTSSSIWLANTAGTPKGHQDRDSQSENKKQLPKPQASKTSSTGLDFCLSDWLLVPAELANQIPDHEEKEKEESEGWSVCSDQTFTSVQYAQDVAVASDYFNKWVL